MGKWIDDFNLLHLNALENCIGTYTFTSKKGRSAIDHVLINENLITNYLGMYVDEDKSMLNISDHNLIRVWFHIGGTMTIKPKKKINKTISWISRDQDKIQLCVSNFKEKIGKKKSFKKCMKKMSSSVVYGMKVTVMKRQRKKKKDIIKAAAWVDEEFIKSVKLRSDLNKQWRYARKKEKTDEVIKKCKEDYYEQKKKTAIQAEQKKSTWEKGKIEETWGDGKAFWKLIPLL